MKRNNRVDAARSKVVPVAESLARTASDKILPAAQSVAAKAVPLAQQAYGKAVPLAQQAYEKAGPRAQQAYGKAVPLAAGAAAAALPLAHQAAEAVSPYAQRAAERLAPLVAGGAAVAHEAMEKVSPVLDDAFDKAGPALETVRDKVSDDLLPRLSTALTAAAASPLAVEAARRGRATAAAARGELTLPEATKGHWVKRVAVVAALAGVAVLVVRKLTAGSQDSGWQAARPSTPFTPPATSTPASASTSAPVVGTFGTAEADAPETDPQAGLSAHEQSALANGQAEPDQPVEGGDVDVPATEEVPLVGDEAATEPAPEETAAPASETSSYGDGAYVGLEPPEGFVIKGNENSMKYHLPSGGGYDQTIAEVWFDSPEAAERAGFTRALG